MCQQALGSTQRDPASMNPVESNQGRLPTSTLGFLRRVHMHAPAHMQVYAHANHTCVHMRPGGKDELKPTTFCLLVPFFPQGEKPQKLSTMLFVKGECLNVCRQPSPPSCVPPIFIFMHSTVKPSSSLHSYSVFGKQIQNLYLHLLNLIFSEEIQIVGIRHNSISLAMKKVHLKK